MDARGMGGAPLPEKTQGWLWGFLWGCGCALFVAAIFYLKA